MLAYFKGTCNWAKVRYEDRDTKFNPDGTYTLDLYLSNEDFDRMFNEVGLQLKLREDQEGNKFVRLNRNHMVEIKGEEKVFGPPKIVDKDNKPLPLDVYIGNGSEVICKLEVYDSKKGIAHRLDTVKVVDLVPYEKPEVSTGDDELVPF